MRRSWVLVHPLIDSQNSTQTTACFCLCSLPHTILITDAANAHLSSFFSDRSPHLLISRAAGVILIFHTHKEMKGRAELHHAPVKREKARLPDQPHITDLSDHTRPGIPRLRAIPLGRSHGPFVVLALRIIP